MKLTPELKKRIDDYFDNIDPAELLNKAIKAGLKEVIEEPSTKKSPANLLNKWCYSSVYDAIIFPTEEDNGDIYGYGIQKTPYNEGWEDNLDFWFEDLEIATEERVKDFLIFEAEMRGFKEGVTINRSQMNGSLNAWSKLAEVITIDKSTYPNEDWFYDMKNDVLEKHGFLIYEKGVWATIVKEEIDWSVPGQLVVASEPNSFIAMTTGEQIEDDVFSAVIVKSAVFSKRGEFSNNFATECFKPYKGEPIILK